MTYQAGNESWIGKNKVIDFLFPNKNKFHVNKAEKSVYWNTNYLQYNISPRQLSFNADGDGFSVALAKVKIFLMI